MSTTDLALASFTADLKTVVETGDAARLAEFLVGRHLPALGGDLEPADVILRALAQEPGLAMDLAWLLAMVLREHEEIEKELTPRKRLKLLNGFHLAAELPTQDNLFLTLIRFDRSKFLGDLLFSYLNALVYQQLQPLKKDWLELLSSRLFGTSIPLDEDYLMLGWRGLLWMPPLPSVAVPDMDRVEEGLLHLHDTVKDTERASPILQYALDILCETYPRSAPFWESSFAPRLVSWPEDLQEQMFLRWPRLRQSSDWVRRAQLRAG